ncbi:hypothetical protein [Bauldia litoralis]|uniref:hypothetical protein n=1 Tax=Bauldia litoralis TaxID=665467 RepID=UPI0032663363
MSEDWRKTFRYRIAIDLVDPLGRGRSGEPVEVALTFAAYLPAADGIVVATEEGVPVLSQIIASSEAGDGRLTSASVCFVVDLPPGAVRTRYYVYLGDSPGPKGTEPGIRRLKPQLGDGVRRLDTGIYEIEICRGTGGGDGGSKWGIRHFEHKDQAINLIHDNNNAFGGVYGPFFTPENGLVNPPAHMVIDFEPIVEGPVMCRYRMRGTVPDGLLPELRGKTIEIWWTFYHGSHWFVRSYYVDDYETTIDGRPCSNRITVGDEIESGKNNLRLSTYRHHDGTRYRAGDLYAEILLERLRDLQARNPEAVNAAMDKLGINRNEDPASWHWDNYWRMFCVIEGALPKEVLGEEVERIWRSANEIVWSDRDHNLMKFTDDAVDVNREPQQTIFPLNAQKTCEFSPPTGYAFVRYVNRVIPRMQIVQRYDSGWVNWGTNGENEYPELPTGSTIWSAYGAFADWRREADCMEQPLAVAVHALERE